MRTAWWGLLVLVACKTDRRADVPSADASIDAPPPPKKVEATPGALARFPDSPVLMVVARGDRSVLVVKTNAELYDREKDGSFKTRGINNEWPQIRAVLAVPIGGGEPVELAKTRTEVTDHACADGRDFAWVDDAPDRITLQVMAIDGEKPRTLVRLPPGGKVEHIACRTNLVLAILSDGKERRVASIDKTDGTIKTLASVSGGRDFSSSSTLTSDQVNAYWFERKGQTRALMQAPLAGGAVTTRFKLADADGHLEFSAHDFDANANGIYWLQAAMNGSYLHRVAPGKKESQSIGDRPVSALGDGFYSGATTIWRLSNDGASLVKVAEGVGTVLGFAARGNRAATFVYAHAGGDATEPGELHLVDRVLEDTARDR